MQDDKDNIQLLSRMDPGKQTNISNHLIESNEPQPQSASVSIRAHFASQPLEDTRIGLCNVVKAFMHHACQRRNVRTHQVHEFELDLVLILVVYLRSVVNDFETRSILIKRRSQMDSKRKVLETKCLMQSSKHGDRR